MAEAAFSIESMARGYHIYESVWTAVTGEEFLCRREIGNSSDSFAVAVAKGDGTTIGHLPRKISCVCSLFLRQGGSIVCRVTGSKRYSVDLAQGGLEIPCRLTFQCDRLLVQKTKKLIKSKLEIEISETDVQPIKKSSDVVNHAFSPNPSTPSSTPHVPGVAVDTNGKKQWIRSVGIELSTDDKRDLLSGNKLDDRFINVAQQLLKKQFPNLAGLNCTLLQAKDQPKDDTDKKRYKLYIHVEITGL